MEKKKLVTRWDILLVLALLLMAALLFARLGWAPPGATAVVELDGTILLTENLPSLAGPRQAAFTGAGGHTVTIELTPASARFLSSTCPDKTCVRTGELTRSGQAALCLPARISLRLEGAESGFDAVTY